MTTNRLKSVSLKITVIELPKYKLTDDLFFKSSTYLSIEVKLIYSVLLVSGIQKNDLLLYINMYIHMYSYIYIYTHTHTHTFSVSYQL